MNLIIAAGAAAMLNATTGEVEILTRSGNTWLNLDSRKSGEMVRFNPDARAGGILNYDNSGYNIFRRSGKGYLTNDGQLFFFKERH